MPRPIGLTFLALGIPNAIRLDGSPSAAMTIDGRLLNPLVSLPQLMAFGPARYVIDGVEARGKKPEPRR